MTTVFVIYCLPAQYSDSDRAAQRDCAGLDQQRDQSDCLVRISRIACFDSLNACKGFAHGHCWARPLWLLVHICVIACKKDHPFAVHLQVVGWQSAQWPNSPDEPAEVPDKHVFSKPLFLWAYFWGDDGLIDVLTVLNAFPETWLAINSVDPFLRSLS